MTTGIKSELQGTMARAEFETTREFSRCSAKQKRWLQVMIENGGDPIQATVAAFDCASVTNAHIYSFAVRRSPKVQAALNLYLGKTERDLLLEKVRYNLKHAEPGSIAAQRLLAQEERLIHGIKPPAEDEPAAENKSKTPAPASVRENATLQAAANKASPPRFHVGQIIADRDQKGIVHTGRVLSVDADGQLLDVEEIAS
jgi:hypothetical protein